MHVSIHSFSEMWTDGQTRGSDVNVAQCLITQYFSMLQR